MGEDHLQQALRLEANRRGKPGFTLIGCAKACQHGEAVFQLDLPDGATVQTLMRQLDVPEELASVIVLNERSGDFEDPLKDGDRVTLIPPLSGG